MNVVIVVEAAKINKLGYRSRYFCSNELVMGLLYNLSIQLYNAGIGAAASFNPKAKLWVAGRKDLISRLKEAFANNIAPVTWMHCASLGEFEQGRPVLEAIKKQYPGQKILLTFFSPSGYEIRKNYHGADWVFYLPADTENNSRQFLNIVKPKLAIFVKYEYWFNYLSELHRRSVPTILISAIFKPESVFFKPYGVLQRKMIGFFDKIFVQDAASKQLLSNISDAGKIEVAGDTRFDRVAEIADAFEPIPVIDKFLKGKTCIVAGSTWPEDEKNIEAALSKIDNKTSLIIAPHEINESHIKLLKSIFKNAILFSDVETATKDNAEIPEKRILIINNIGMLSRLYKYATITYIGGGFNKSGIHNTLEAAVYGKPVIFGPNYHKFAEAIKLIENGGGFSYNNENELVEIINTLLMANENAGKQAANFVKEKKGATQKILRCITANYMVQGEPTQTAS